MQLVHFVDGLDRVGHAPTVDAVDEELYIVMREAFPRTRVADLLSQFDENALFVRLVGPDVAYVPQIVETGQEEPEAALRHAHGLAKALYYDAVALGDDFRKHDLHSFSFWPSVKACC